MTKSSSEVTLLIAVCVLVSVLGVVQADDTQQTVLFGQNKHAVTRTEFERDGNKYLSYDFGKGVFTVDEYYLNLEIGSSVEMRWYWPILKPIRPGYQRNGAPLVPKYNLPPDYSEVRIVVDFTDVNRFIDGNDVMERWHNNNCLSTTGQKDEISRKTWCDQEIPSDLKGFKKFIKDRKGESITYIALPDGPKSPQNRPLVIHCLDKTYLPTNHEPKDLTCGTNFQYFGQISGVVEFRGDVLQRWQELLPKVNEFFKTRMQEK